EPGIMSQAYSSFHNYSVGNQLLAWAQCLARGIQPGPIATFQRWKELGRHVRKGEKAIVLCQPVTVKRTRENEDRAEDAETFTFTRFVYRPHWFVMAQTDGAQLLPIQTTAWDRARACCSLRDGDS